MQQGTQIDKVWVRELLPDGAFKRGEQTYIQRAATKEPLVQSKLLGLVIVVGACIFVF